MASQRSTSARACACCAAALCALHGLAAVAQVVAPQALETPQPETPTVRAGMPLEGWAVVRFTVQADGRVADARVVDRMPPQLPDRGVRNTVENWTFEPATADGEPIDWYNNETVVVFDAVDVPPEPSEPFMEGYSEADAYLRTDAHENALRSNERTLQTTATRLGELALANVQNAAINIALGDHHAAYASILRATDPRVPILGAEALELALQHRNVLELQLGDVEAALATLERRRALAPVADDDPVASRIAEIEAALAAEDSVIGILAKLIDERWQHVPTRRTFSIGNVEGSVDSIRVECDRRTADLEYMPDSEWTLPESWGDCLLTIEGKGDSTFRFFELL